MKVAAKTFVCLLAVIAGYGIALLLAMGALALFGVPAFEGERATLAAFAIGPIGALAGLYGGGYAAQRLFHEPTGLGSIARLAGVTLVVVSVLGALGAVVGMLSGGSTFRNSAAPRLAFEIRAPAVTADAGDMRRWRVNLETPGNQMPATLSSPRRDGPSALLAGEVEMYYRTASRMLALDLGDGRTHLFELRIPATPKSSTGWSPWVPASKSFAPGQSHSSVGDARDRIEIRTRVTVF